MVRKYDYYKIGHNYEILKGKRVIIWCCSITALDRIAYNNGMGEGLTEKHGAIITGTFNRV